MQVYTSRPSFHSKTVYTRFICVELIKRGDRGETRVLIYGPNALRQSMTGGRGGRQRVEVSRGREYNPLPSWSVCVLAHWHANRFHTHAIAAAVAGVSVLSLRVAHNSTPSSLIEFSESIKRDVVRIL